MGTLSDRLNIKFGSLDSNAGVFGGAGGGEKDRWAAAKWDHKKDTYLQLKFGTFDVCVRAYGTYTPTHLHIHIPTYPIPARTLACNGT